MNGEKYTICRRCVMDTTDPDIRFDDARVCNHCLKYDADRAEYCLSGSAGREHLEAVFRRVKEAGRGAEYDSLIGLSGGMDSSFVAALVKEAGLRPLVVHVDTGWNSEIASGNIERIVKKLGFDLYTYVVDWEEMRDLQTAFLKAALPNQDTPQDHAIFTVLNRLAVRKNIRILVSGHNYATESVMPSAWGYNAMDGKHLTAVYRRFGRKPLRRYPVSGLAEHYFYTPFVRRINIVRPLNYVEYNKEEVTRRMERELDWRAYGAKHYESRFTKFFQGYYLPKKFGFDKRRAHFSSLVLSGQMSRENALFELKKPPYPEEELGADREFIIKKLGVTEVEFEGFMSLPNRSHRDYPNDEWILRGMNGVRRRLIRGRAS